jgi:GNAT superfamily N-acetyltransferase
MAVDSSGPTGAVVRSWRTGDEPAIERLLTLCCGNDPARQAPFRVHGAPLDGDEFRRTLLVEPHGGVAAVGTLWRYWLHPGRRRLALHVAPRFRGQGLGGSLFRSLLSAPAPAMADLPVQMATYADDRDGRRFLERRGFELLMRTRLGVVDPNRRSAAVRRDLDRATEDVLRAGYCLRTLPELAARDPGVGLALARVHAEGYRAGHAWNPSVPLDDRDAMAIFLDDDDLIPAAQFAATFDDVPVAVGSLRRASSPGEVDLGWIGTVHRHQRQAANLTLALLGRCLDEAAQRQARVRIEVDEADPLLWAAVMRVGPTTSPDWLTFVSRRP